MNIVGACLYKTLKDTSNFRYSIIFSLTKLLFEREICTRMARKFVSLESYKALPSTREHLKMRTLRSRV